MLPSRALSRIALAVMALIGIGPGVRSAFAQAAAAPTFRALTAGHDFTCGIATDDRAFCWGANYLGQLGTPRATGRCEDGFPERGACSRVALPVAGEIRFASLRAGKAHACGIDLEGTAWCWGEASAGQLGATAADECLLEGERLQGLPPLPCSRTPLRVPSAVRFVAIGAGEDVTCALDDSARAWCWGSRGANSAPALVPLDAPVTSLAVAGGNACALTTEQEARCWSWPEVLERGAEATTGARRWKAIAVAPAHACAIDAEDGTVACWGNDADGALGRGKGEHRRYVDAPLAPIAGSARFDFIAVSATRSCAVQPSGTLECWGRLGPRFGDDRCLDSNGYGGSNDCTSTPVVWAKGRQVRGVTLGDQHGCVILSSGPTACWGSNQWGQLGDGTRLGSESLVFLSAGDRSSSPLVWVREHRPSKVTVWRAVLLLLACFGVVAALRWRPRSGERPAAAGTARPAADKGGLLSVGLVAAGWALFASGLLAPHSGGHDDVALGLAWLAILIVGAVSCVLVAIGGGLAIATLRRDRSSTLARIGIVLAVLTLSAAALALSLLA